MVLLRSLSVLVALPLLALPPVVRADSRSPVVPFGVLKPMPPEVAQGHAWAWLTSVKPESSVRDAFQQLWSSDRPVLDRVAGTFALGDVEAARLLVAARQEGAPTEVPALFKDATKPLFYRANLGLAYGRLLGQRRIYEESLAILSLFRPEQVVSPAAYLFHRGVAEFSLMKRPEASRTLTRLLEDVPDAPERYRAVAAAMTADLAAWQEKDLGAIARMMDNVERRLALTRGGPTTRGLQKRIIARLDELIKEREQSAGDGAVANGGNCPPGGAPAPGGAPSQDGLSSQPQPDSFGGDLRGPGNVDPKKLKAMAEVWGKLPEKERARAMIELTRDLPAHRRQLIENYFKAMARAGHGE